ncbi:hypothetical protein F2P81_004909 [Scophthalmus maximus]|uniref:Uncharacterized protein n=1 Tax=Scophthalmus maximus TaxID=52904 RepID=A0A6A4TNK0_SCOMX|nr:hypothetical protein F2P81_004909 [Scophthalmus maximus]
MEDELKADNQTTETEIISKVQEKLLQELEKKGEACRMEDLYKTLDFMMENELKADKQMVESENNDDVVNCMLEMSLKLPALYEKLHEWIGSLLKDLYKTLEELTERKADKVMVESESSIEK